MIVHCAVTVTSRGQSHPEETIVPLERYSRHLEVSALRNEFIVHTSSNLSLKKLCEHNYFNKLNIFKIHCVNHNW